MAGTETRRWHHFPCLGRGTESCVRPWPVSLTTVFSLHLPLEIALIDDLLVLNHTPDTMTSPGTFHPKFNDPQADLVLECQDGVKLRAHSYMLMAHRLVGRGTRKMLADTSANTSEPCPPDPTCQQMKDQTWYTWTARRLSSPSFSN